MRGGDVAVRDELGGPVRAASVSGPAPDEAGFRLWAASRRSTLRRTAYLMCADWHHADDLVQDALVKVYARWARIASRGDVDAYVRRVLVTTFLDGRRRPWRRESSYAVVPDTRTDEAAVRALQAVEGTPQLEAALAQLPPGQRAVLVLRFFEDLSVEQTADLLSCSTGNVKSQSARGLVRLRALLGVDVVEGGRGSEDGR